MGLAAPGERHVPIARHEMPTPHAGNPLYWAIHSSGTRIIRSA